MADLDVALIESGEQLQGLPEAERQILVEIFDIVEEIRRKTEMEQCRFIFCLSDAIFTIFAEARNLQNSVARRVQSVVLDDEGVRLQTDERKGYFPRFLTKETIAIDDRGFSVGESVRTDPYFFKRRAVTSFEANDRFQFDSENDLLNLLTSFRDKLKELLDYISQYTITD